LMRYDLKLECISFGRRKRARKPRVTEPLHGDLCGGTHQRVRVLPCLRSTQCRTSSDINPVEHKIYFTDLAVPIVPIMRGKLASVAAATTVLLLFISFYTSIPIPTPWTLHKPSEPVLGQKPYAGWPSPVPWDPPKPEVASGQNPAERLIIKVALEEEDTSAIDSLAPTWQNTVILVEPLYSHAHPKAHRSDKGRVANAYLTWIVENYHDLPETLLFIPPRDSLEETPLDIRGVASTLQIPFIQTSGFVNLRCPSQKSRTTCNDHVLEPFAPTNEFRTLETNITQTWAGLFGKGTKIPLQIATVLGAEFAVSRAQVQMRSVEEYLKYWAWLNRTIMDDDSAGLVMEYLWHVVFGMNAIFCPERVRCECELYGKCEGE
jgi:hypothetical protein